MLEGYGDVTIPGFVDGNSVHDLRNLLASQHDSRIGFGRLLLCLIPTYQVCKQDFATFNGYSQFAKMTHTKFKDFALAWESYPAKVDFTGRCI
jgi:hypothetical protein